MHGQRKGKVSAYIFQLHMIISNFEAGKGKNTEIL